MLRSLQTTKAIEGKGSEARIGGEDACEARVADGGMRETLRPEFMVLCIQDGSRTCSHSVTLTVVSMCGSSPREDDKISCVMARIPLDDVFGCPLWFMPAPRPKCHR